MKKISFALALFSLSFLQLNAQCSNASRPGIHVVQSGENLYRIAKMYGLSTIEVASWNNLPNNPTLSPCQEIIIATNYRGSTVSTNTFTERAPSYSGNAYRKQVGNKHIIQQGESIRGLAQLYGYTEDRFRKINLLKAGEELSVGSKILSSDCACDRVLTYEEMNNGNNNNSGYGSNVNSGFNHSSSSIISSSNQDEFQDRGDSYYDSYQGSVGGNSNPPAVVPIDSRNQIRSANPTAYNTESARIGRTMKASATYMTNEELLMLDEINLVRSNPAGYIPYIEQYKRDIQSGKSFGSSLAVCDELIAELRRTPRLAILKPAPCIYNAAKKHGLDQLNRGSTGHDGSDGSWPWDRVKRECPQMTDGNENLVGGPSDVREAVILLLVDDGIPSRGHRKTLLNKNWVYGTCYKIGKVGFMPNCWVQKFGF